MRFFLFFFIFLFCLIFLSKAQNGDFQLGARSAALGHASVTIHDNYAVFNNISGIAKEEEISATFAFENRFGISSFNSIGAGVIIPQEWGNTTLNVFKFGDEFFSEHKVGLGYAHKLGMVSLGAQANYIQYNIEGFGTTGSFALEVGGIAEIIPELIFGAHVFNVSQSKINKFDEERIAIVIKSGLSYRPLKKLMINFEAEKDVDFKARYKAGVEYEIIQKFFIRSGFEVGDKKGFHGIGFWPGRLRIDYALSNNFQLGFSHQASVSYRFHGKHGNSVPQ